MLPRAGFPWLLLFHRLSRTEQGPEQSSGRRCYYRRHVLYNHRQFQVLLNRMEAEKQGR